VSIGRERIAELPLGVNRPAVPAVPGRSCGRFDGSDTIISMSFWFFGAFTVLLFATPTVAVCEAGPSGRLAAGQVIYLSTRLESVTKSPGKKVIAGWSRGSTGIQTWEEGGPYVVEACTPFKVRKVAVDKALVFIKDQAGIRHTLAGDWSGSIHSGEPECRKRFDVHPGATVRENEKLRYESPGHPSPAESEGAAQSTPP
jgi:hypothetical protein